MPYVLPLQIRANFLIIRDRFVSDNGFIGYVQFQRATVWPLFISLLRFNLFTMMMLEHFITH